MKGAVREYAYWYGASLRATYIHTHLRATDLHCIDVHREKVADGAALSLQLLKHLP